ncbi:hypothetical protein [Plantactinospora sp. B5E13]|uniref:hypothetical protein n=1 Tax=unclassified Plantactinospora TaxID=2631981 RepID=UPI00325C5695
MTYPYGPGIPSAPVAYPQPVALPAGFGALVVTVNRGPYLIPVPTVAKLQIDGRHVPISGEGTWHIPLPAGPHEVRYTDFIGIPMVTTRAVVVPPGAASVLDFRFGVWRNRVHDGQGTDITKFGMWSNYLVGIVTFVAVLVLCCGGVALLGGLGALNNP